MRKGPVTVAEKSSEIFGKGLLRQPFSALLVDMTDITEILYCEHDDDVSMIDRNGNYRSNPYADYWYLCETCGSIGNPDGPDSDGREAIDWDANVGDMDVWLAANQFDRA